MKTEIRVNESVSTAIIRAVSAVKGREPDSLQPLTDVIDPDALDALFDRRSNDGRRTDGRFSFSYSRCRITVDNGEFLTIEPLETTGRLKSRSDDTVRAERSHSDRDTQQTATESTPGSRICYVCQRPIRRDDLQRERGELVHPKCGPELRYGISLTK